MVPERGPSCYFSCCSCCCSCSCYDTFEKVLRLFHFFTERDKILYEHTRDNSSSIDGFRFLNFATKFENAAKIGSFSLQSAWPQNAEVRDPKMLGLYHYIVTIIRGVSSSLQNEGANEKIISFPIILRSGTIVRSYLLF